MTKENSEYLIERYNNVYEVVIGLEVHAQVTSNSKLFSSSSTKFGADIHNAHVQPDGTYHYHGNPNAMFDDSPSGDGSPVIGFAADGFPIYGSYIYNEQNGMYRKVLSGYSVKQGSRGERTETNPGGDFTGLYEEDWEWTNAGDLDECNGMEYKGKYGYYITESYPYIINCFKGEPDASFNK